MRHALGGRTPCTSDDDGATGRLPCRAPRVIPFRADASTVAGAR